MSQDSLYRKEYKRNGAKWASINPELLKAYISFADLAVAEGILSVSFKELIAIAVAHATGCPYCIDAHVVKAKSLSVTREQLFESIGVAAFVKAESAYLYSVNALNAFDGSGDDELFKRSYLEREEEWEAVNEDLYGAFAELRYRVLQSGAIAEKDKLIIAVAVAHVEGNAYAIDRLTRKAKEKGAAKGELAEAIAVATALKAGAAFSHRFNAIQAFEQDETVSS
ncbi:carboxymuconolactone decarboxylase family protein [Cohnella abietis]|uniref:Carboxymuconolactone decarboxylase-like domain-containing protein n=1 Tax=Cohnella abietis TaxID=2507935 RepID=A0A3T1DC95_9BACL|nr:carboxymuconolactone decarboxylase family protein [Cohnella abietis]BBI35578.1 hypothetical protein KCTCHS21_49770 [Cohnella abietis]